MAAREHSCTRRDLLAGAAGAVLPSPWRSSNGCPSPLQGEGVQGEWEEALAALRRAEEEVAAFKRVEPEGASFAAQWEMDEAFSDLVSAQNGALERLLLVPAPDLAALALKLALVVEELAWELPQGEAAMARLAADAQGLAG